MTDKLIAVCFIAGAPPYRAGEVAGFSDEEAKSYVDRGLARMANPDDLAASAPKPAADAPEKLIVVRFVASHPPYLAGELAGFSLEHADRLVNAGVAELHGEASPKARPDPVTPPKQTSAEVDPTLVKVEFVKPSAGYRVGEIAGFPADVAKAYIEEGLAVEPGTAPATQEGTVNQLPDPKKVDENAEVLGLDDKDPGWREKAGAKALDEPPADKMVGKAPKAKDGK